MATKRTAARRTSIHATHAALEQAIQSTHTRNVKRLVKRLRTAREMADGSTAGMVREELANAEHDLAVQCDLNRTPFGNIYSGPGHDDTTAAVDQLHVLLRNAFEDAAISREQRDQVQRMLADSFASIEWALNAVYCMSDDARTARNDA